MRSLALTLLLPLGLAACYREADLGDLRSAPVVVINSLVMPGAPVAASVDRTWFYPDGAAGGALSRAEVELYLNGRYGGRMEPRVMPCPWQPGRTDTFFVSGLVVSEGDSVVIRVTDSACGTAEAGDRVPRAVPVLDVRPVVRAAAGCLEVLYEITFDDPPAAGDRYLLSVRRQVEDGDGPPRWEAADVAYADPVFHEDDAPLDGSLGFDGTERAIGALFTDRHLDGRRHTLRVRERVAATTGADRRLVTLCSLSEACYLYLSSWQRWAGSTLAGDLSAVGLGDPLRVYTNVAGGTGILAGLAPSAWEVELPASLSEGEDAAPAFPASRGNDGAGF